MKWNVRTVEICCVVFLSSSRNVSAKITTTTNNNNNSNNNSSNSCNNNSSSSRETVVATRRMQQLTTLLQLIFRYQCWTRYRHKKTSKKLKKILFTTIYFLVLISLFDKLLILVKSLMFWLGGDLYTVRSGIYCMYCLNKGVLRKTALDTGVRSMYVLLYFHFVYDRRRFNELSLISKSGSTDSTRKVSYNTLFAHALITGVCSHFFRQSFKLLFCYL